MSTRMAYLADKLDKIADEVDEIQYQDLSGEIIAHSEALRTVVNNISGFRRASSKDFQRILEVAKSCKVKCDELIAMAEGNLQKYGKKPTGQTTTQAIKKVGEK